MTSRTPQQWIVRTSTDVGRAVGDLRCQQHFTQAELAASIGIGRTWLSKIESGVSSRVLEHLLRLVRRLDATVTITFDNDQRQHDGQT